MILTTWFTINHIKHLKWIGLLVATFIALKNNHKNNLECWLWFLVKITNISFEKKLAMQDIRLESWYCIVNVFNVKLKTMEGSSKL